MEPELEVFVDFLKTGGLLFSLETFEGKEKSVRLLF
jgi:hypothetical protein